MYKMAVRAIKSAALSEFCMRSVASSHGLASSPNLGQIRRRVNRDLFGSAGSAEINKIINEELENFHTKATEKWGFDFRNGCPLAAETGYVWERVSTEQAVHEPPVYTLTRAAHLCTSTVEPTASCLLMDDRVNALYSSSANSSFAASPQKYEISSTCSSSPQHAPTPTPTLMQTHSPTTPAPQQRKRQAKITDFMKERKRLLPASKKISPAKRMRTNASSKSITAITSIFVQTSKQRGRHLDI